MKLKICPRIFGCAVLASLFLGSAPAFTQATNTTLTSPAGTNQLVRLQGELEILFQDLSDGHSRALYSLKQADGKRVPLQFTKNPPTQFMTGDHVVAGGQMSGRSLLLYSGSNLTKTTSKASGGSGSTSTTSSAIPVPNTFGVQSVLVVMVNFQDDVVEPYTAAEAQAALFGAGNSTNTFILENSYGQTSLGGAVVGWYTIPVSITSCDTAQIAGYAQSAAVAAGVNLSSYTRYVYLFPRNNACGFGGASTMGGNPSQSWINGTLDPDIVNHELGHAFGLWHSHLLDCGPSAIICSNGTIVEYGDQMDVMGTVQTAVPHYNAFQKEQLGWLNFGTSPAIQTVTTSGTYTITPYEDGSGPNALKVLQSVNSTTGAKTWYYLESRQAIGADAFLTTWPYSTTQNTTTGVLLHLGTEGNGNSSLMLNMSPAIPTYQFEMALPAGQTFHDSTAGVTFTTVSVTSTGATVDVQLSNSTTTTTTSGRRGKGH